VPPLVRERLCECVVSIVAGCGVTAGACFRRAAISIRAGAFETAAPACYVGAMATGAPHSLRRLLLDQPVRVLVLRGAPRKGLPFTVTEISLPAGEQRASAYRARAFTGKVPALAHGDFWLTESSAIVEYLDEVYPAPAHTAVLPAEPLARARARQVMAWIRSDLMPLREERPTTTMFYTKATTPLSPAGEAAAASLLHVAEALVPTASPHLFGTWSIADADLTFMLHRLLQNDHPVPPQVAAYARKQWQRPSVQEWVTHNRKPFVPY
jgi:glutathione S-transferase